MRLRVRFTKLGKVRFTGHRDVARIWERAIRRTGLPIAYSTGFSPHPRVSFGLALSTGYESLGEYLDIELAGPLPEGLDVLPERLSAALPVGIDVVAMAEIEPRTASLQEAVTSCTWRITLPDLGADAVREGLAAALAAPTLVATRERKGVEVTDDLRPAILAGRAEGVAVVVDLATQPRGLRPAELVAAVWPGGADHRALRLHQWIEESGTRREPLAAPASPHALERAS